MLPAVFISLFYREATILSRSDSFGFFKLTMKIRYVGITGSLGDFSDGVVGVFQQSLRSLNAFFPDQLPQRSARGLLDDAGSPFHT